MPQYIDKELFKDIIGNYIREKCQEMIKQESDLAVKRLQERFEKEALQIAMYVAQQIKVDSINEAITISVVKK